MNVLIKLRSCLNKGSERSVKAKKNIVYMMLIKGGSILAGLLLVPLTLHYVDSDTYGIWLTLSSMIGWISFFDIGLNNGLKNRLAEAIAQENDKLGKTYVSTTYAFLAFIFIPVMVILLIVVPFLDWQSILNLKDVYINSLVISVSIVITYFCINFILSTINIVIIADQRPADASLRTFLQQLVTIAIIYVLTLTTDGNLVYLCLALCFAPLLVVGAFNFILFKGRYSKYSPSFKYVDFKKAPDLFNLGIRFFIIQVAGIIQFQMVNFFIIRYYGASVVTAYNVANKYFSVLYMVWGILIMPLWAAVTDAKVKGDFSWIKNAQLRYFKLFIPFAFGAVLMLLISNFAYNIWIGNSVTVPFLLSFWVMIYNIILMYGSTYVNILNGMGKLKVQTIACILSPFVFICVTYLLIRMGVGVYSIIIGAVVANFNGYLLAPVQCYKLFSKK